ncbi:hypothetical protein GQ53DRAFT_843913 [Thozetella sp. PMI_491]|nr:hypothetical protein GQ53DRAFT_843913 [Thozetella sp. PMI_491]
MLPPVGPDYTAKIPFRRLESIKWKQPSRRTKGTAPRSQAISRLDTANLPDQTPILSPSAKMQIKNSVALLAAVLPSALATLPGTFEMLVFQDGVKAGCINGRGNYTKNLQWCYPFVSSISVDPYSYVRGYERCAITAAGTLSCYENGGLQDEFHLIAPDFATKNATVATWSSDIEPVGDDTVGVEIYPGGDHAFNFYLQVHAISG